jgi:hypothetical protein
MVQALSMDKFYKHNLVQPLVHRDYHELPKPHMGLYMFFHMYFLYFDLNMSYLFTRLLEIK